MTTPHIVNHDEWLAARKAFLAKEKAFTRQREELARERRALPWEKVDKAYAFEGPQRKLSLADLFLDVRGAQGGFDSQTLAH